MSASALSPKLLPLVIATVAATVLGMIVATPSRAGHAGQLDPSFNNGKVVGPNFFVGSTLVLPDDRIMIGGMFTKYNGVDRPYVARLKADGALDPTFAQKGSGLNNWVFAMARQPDGKIIVAGKFTLYGLAQRPHIARLNVDGSLDPSFVPTGSGFDGDINTLAVQSDGKILVGGAFTHYDGHTVGHLARLNTDGTMDGAFTSYFNDSVKSVAVQPNGRIVVGGAFTLWHGLPAPHIARLTDNGGLDPTFLPGAGFDATVMGVALQGNGKILAGGEFTACQGQQRHLAARLNTDGTLDPTFTQGGWGFDGSVVVTIRPLADGKILAGGGFTGYNGFPLSGLARLNPNGSNDTGFGPIADGFQAGIMSIGVQSTGRIVVAGQLVPAKGDAFGLARILARTTPDPVATTLSGWPAKKVTKKRKVTVTVTVSPHEARSGRLERKTCTSGKCAWTPLATVSWPVGGTTAVTLKAKKRTKALYRLELPATATSKALTSTTAKVVRR